MITKTEALCGWNLKSKIIKSKINKVEAIIKLENAVIRQQKNTILKDVSLEIKEGEFVTSEQPVSGEVYFTDQTTGTFSVGGYATVGTDGKLVSTTAATRIQVRNTAAKDCGTHIGIEVAILD